jgi:hypothetical protein
MIALLLFVMSAHADIVLEGFPEHADTVFEGFPNSITTIKSMNDHSIVIHTRHPSNTSYATYPPRPVPDSVVEETWTCSGKLSLEKRRTGRVITETEHEEWDKWGK